MILQFASDGNLQEYLRKNFVKLQWIDKLNIAKEIVNGLLFLHDNSIIHRNLHSKNVLIHRGQIKITDFSLTKQIDEVSLSSKSNIHGMLAYIDPECLFVPKYERNKKSDIYSLGVILWEISSGRPPYESSESNLLYFQAIQGVMEEPIEGTPLKYVELYKQCWDQIPSLRPETKLVHEMSSHLIESVQNLDLVEIASFDDSSSLNKYENDIKSRKKASSLDWDLSCKNIGPNKKINKLVEEMNLV
ncbi:kinase-like protein [Gigaspora margarita]|uniref:Kinase-like protein n=1 Tax=Gigaspora margarita TaxID=4874 RepID=A0A8H3XMD1_GIGMA|nr:kinase-like protein [Gigaspora margarita]